MGRAVAVVGSFGLAWCVALSLARGQGAAPASPPSPTTGLTTRPATGPSTAPYGPMVDNPHYLAWSRFKPGTQVEMDMSVGVGGQKMVTKVAMTLSDVSAERAVVDTVARISVPGLPGAGDREEKQTRTFAAKVHQSEAERAFMPSNAIGESRETGTETVAAAGREYRCTVREFDGTIQNQPAKGKMWRSERVPGGLVKMEASGAPNLTVTMELKGVREK